MMLNNQFKADMTLFNSLNISDEDYKADATFICHRWQSLTSLEPTIKNFGGK
jgi:hypothetical protein